MAREKMTLQEQANEILQKAGGRGVESNVSFVSTFKRYQVQMRTLQELERARTWWSTRRSPSTTKRRRQQTAPWPR